MVGPKIKIAQIELYGQLVGALALDQNKGLCSFEYHKNWLNTGIEISPIHLPLSNKIYSFPSLNSETYKGLPGAFADTLPDDFGNAIIDAWLARTGQSKQSFTAIDRLLYTGSRGMGALEYAPSIHPKNEHSAAPVEIESLMQMAQQVLDERAGIKLDLADDSQSALMTMMQVGTSAGGARAKAVIGLNNDRTQIRSGQVDLPEGFEHWLLKFDGVVENTSHKETFGDPKGYGRMEYAYYLMAKQAGINISESDLLQDDDRAHFMTKRFDRVGGKKTHYQSLCAMAHADYKMPGHYSYEQLFALMRQLRLPRNEAIEMFRRMVFNIVARNHDDHTKNFGFMHNANKQWTLAPAFDVAYSYRPDSPWVNQHQLSLNGKRDDFSREDLMVIGRLFDKEATEIIDNILDVVSSWPIFAKIAGVFPDFAKLIAANHRLEL